MMVVVGLRHEFGIVYIGEVGAGIQWMEGEVVRGGYEVWSTSYVSCSGFLRYYI